MIKTGKFYQVKCGEELLTVQALGFERGDGKVQCRVETPDSLFDGWVVWAEPADMKLIERPVDFVPSRKRLALQRNIEK